MILTLKELANYLRVNERTILRMQQAGQITGVKIGGQWRFNGSQIDKLFFPGKDTQKQGGVPLSDFTRSHLAVPISRILKQDRMIMDLQSEDCEGAIEELCAVVRQQRLVLDAKDFYQRVMGREELLSTGVGNGIAIPHPRDPIPTLSELSVIVVGKSRKGIEWNAVDSAPVHLVFLLCSQNIQMHLHMMGRLAHLLRSEAVIEEIKRIDTSEDLLRYVMDAERRDFLGGENEPK